MYLIACVPTPAVDGKNCPLETPGPLYTPPVGEPPVNVNGAASIQTLLKEESVALGAASTLIVDVSDADRGRSGNQLDYAINNSA